MNKIKIGYFADGPWSHLAFEKINNNKLIIRLQPEERIELVQMTKIPGPGGYRYKPIALKLDYVDSFEERFPEGLIGFEKKGASSVTIFEGHKDAGIYFLNKNRVLNIH